jgi:DUF4097 and DUF4098 domain-containing protein YvlB
MTMKKIILMVILILLMVVGFSLQAAQKIEKEIAVEPGQKLNVDLKSGGSITIKGWDKNKVSIVARFKNGGSEDWDVDIKKTSDGISVETRYSGSRHGNHGGSDVEIQVPQKFDVKLRTMGGGVKIAGVEGDFTGKTMGGGLELSHLKGFINLKTMGGGITLSDSDIDGKVKTMGGRVLLENVMGDVSGSSMGGNVIYKNVKSRSGKSTGKIVNISTMGGDINVSEANHGAKVHTMGGNIHIKSAKEFISAKTMGGKINVDAIDGWIKATTMGGDVSVTMTGDPAKGKRDVTLTSMGGDITLNVPAGLSMDIDITLAYTRRSRQDYKIVSDFDIDRERTDEWDDSKGSDRKYIYGKGKIKGGTHKITIKTVNGNIYLKKN